MRQFAYGCLFLILICASVHAQENEYGLAVLDLQANGIAATEALALSDVLRSSILKIIQEQKSKITGSYRLIERSQMDKIFEEFEVQNTGCTDVSCAIEFGKMLNVERIIIGSVGLVGSTYIVVVRIVDVETSNTLVSVDRTVPSPVDNVINLMSAVSHELLTGERLNVPIVQAPAAPSSLPALSPSVPVTPPMAPSTLSVISGGADQFGIQMVPIPAGSFQMGSYDGESDEKPTHTVTLSAFEMSSEEITQGQYKVVMGKNPSWFTGDNNLPVENVSWNDAVEFCRALSQNTGSKFRLPTEAEWEDACRAGSVTYYYTGNSASDLGKAGWYKGNSGSKTHPVGQKRPNAWGLYDMHGNVWEWCNDRYVDYYGSSPSTDPAGPLSGARRVSRGGSCYNFARNCRSGCRNSDDPSHNNIRLGFRIVRRP